MVFARRRKTHRKVVVIGIDAATYNIINYLVSKGKLTTFKKVMQAGFSTTLRSCDPPITFPAWKCLTTGLNPGKLGVYCFYVWDKKVNKLRFVSSRDFKAKDIWDYLGLSGYRVAIINVPGTFPPRKVDGYMISGHFAFDSRNYTYPPELKNFLIKRFNYRVEFLKDFKTIDKNDLTQEAIEMIKTRFEVTKYFITEKEVDFVFTVIFLTDNFQHYFWLELPNSGNPIEKLYEAIDGELNELIRIANDENFNLLLVSDHGMCKKNLMFELNTWLYLKGYLTLKNDMISNSKLQLLTEFFRRIGLIDKVAPKFIRFLSTEQIYKLIDRLQEKDRLSDISLFDLVDWEKTMAFALGHNCIYVLSKNPKVKKEIIEKLSEVKDPRTGYKIFRKIKLKEEAYGAKCLGYPPDIILVPEGGYLANSKISKHLDPYDYSMDGWVAVHDYNGIFIAYGPDINSNNDPSQVFEIYDVTPTILYMYGLPRPELDGKVRMEIFKS